MFVDFGLKEILVEESWDLSLFLYEYVVLVNKVKLVGKFIVEDWVVWCLFNFV